MVTGSRRGSSFSCWQPRARHVKGSWRDADQELRCHLGRALATSRGVSLGVGEGGKAGSQFINCFQDCFA